MKSKTRFSGYLSGAFLFLLCAVSCFGQTSEGSARQAAEDFYRLHFQRADRMYFKPANIRLKRKWLTPKLYRLMQYEFRREAEFVKAHPDEKPYFEGDVFTDADSLPQVYRVTSSRESPRQAIVTVWVYWNDDTVGKMKKRVRVVYLKQGQQWLIDNLLYEDGENLVKQLTRPVYQ